MKRIDLVMEEGGAGEAVMVVAGAVEEDSGEEGEGEVVMAAGENVSWWHCTARRIERVAGTVLGFEI